MAKKKKIWLPENIHRGKSGRYGQYYQHKDTKELIYVAEKKDRRTGVFHETNSLAIDIETLKEVEKRGVRFIVVKIRSTGDKYATRLATFNSEAAVLNYDKRGGSLQRYLPIAKFVERKSTKLKM
ncbi:MAG: hypothetical protein ACXWT0_03825 [Methylobacter sp.]